MPDQLFYSNVPIGSGNQLYLERPQLYGLLEKAIKSPIVTVTAGAGYGKTQAVYSFVRKYNVVTVWMQLFERDNLGLHFWDNFCRVVEFTNSDTAAKIREIGFPETEEKLDRYLRILHDAVMPNRKYILVYDDVHLIREKSVLRFLEYSINGPFSNITSVLISRTELKINTIPLLSKGYLARISEEDLRFTPDEIRAYFQLQGLQVHPDVYNEVYRDTEGWAFAIHLAVLALKPDVREIRYTPSAVKLNIFKLIESEITAHVSAELRKFLVKISLIDHKAMDILSDLAGETGVLDELEQLGSFVRYDPYLNVWRLHNLFLEYLYKKQGELSAEEKREVYITAARWCEENHLRMDAISYFEKAGDYESFFKLVYSLHQFLPSALAHFLLEILDRAPESLFRENPRADFTRMRIFIALGRLDEASAGLWDIIDKITKIEASDSKSDALTVRNNRILMGCYFNLGFIGYITCMHTRDYGYVQYVKRAHYYYRLSGREYPGLRVPTLLTSYLCRVQSAEKGEIERYINALTEMSPFAAEIDGGVTYGMDDLAWAELAFFRNDTERAEQMAYRALSKGQEKNQHEIASRAVFYLIRINIYKGNSEKIAELLKILEAQLGERTYLNRHTYYDIQTGWFYSQIGQNARLAPWLKSEFGESDLNSTAFGLEVLIRARYFFVQGDYRKALEVMEKHTHKYGLGGFLFGTIGGLLMKSGCLYALKDLAGAMHALEDAYALSVPNGLDMFFIEQGKYTRALFTAARKFPGCTIPRDWLLRMLRGSAAYAKKLYVVAEKFRDMQYADAAAPVFLSRRELSVFKGLARGLTRDELAEDGDISINTVKSVIRSVYSKLGAVNRADAVRIGTGMGILKNDDPRNNTYPSKQGV
jgi:LuxR family maltose regulon positive regulatory protein